MYLNIFSIIWKCLAAEGRRKAPDCKRKEPFLALPLYFIGRTNCKSQAGHEGEKTMAPLSCHLMDS